MPLWSVLQRRATWYPKRKCNPVCGEGLDFSGGSEALSWEGGEGKQRAWRASLAVKWADLVGHSPHARYHINILDTSCSLTSQQPCEVRIAPRVTSSTSWHQRTIFPGAKWSQKWQLWWAPSQRYNQLMGAETKLTSAVSRETTSRKAEKQTELELLCGKWKGKAINVNWIPKQAFLIYT